jgi:hypothetical protein
VSSGVSYTRERLRAEQNLARRYGDQARRSDDTAARLLDAGLVQEAAEELELIRK